MFYMNRHIFSFLLVAGLTVVSACSVKEDRRPCPGYLRVTVPGDERIVTEVGMIGWNDREIFRHSHDLSADGRQWVKTVRKEKFVFGAWCGNRSMNDAGHCLIVPEGKQCDSLYAYYAPVELDENVTEADLEVVMKKQFATVRVDLNESEASLLGLVFTATSNTCGFDLDGFEPVEGAFRYEFVSVPGQRVVAFRVPRQGDDSLALVVKTNSGLPVTTIRLGELIKQTGFSWRTGELQDVFVTIDFQYSVVELRVEGWETGVVTDFIES